MHLTGINFFNGPQEAGWSEVYAFPGSDYTVAATSLTALANRRLAMMCEDCEHIGGRVSDADVRGDALIIPAEGVGVYSVMGINTETPNVCLKLRADTVDHLHHGIRYLRGIPDDQLDGSTYTPTVAWAGKLDDYIAQVFSDCRLMSVDRSVSPPVYTFRVIGTLIPIGIWTRDSGRPFILHRGHR